MYIIQIVNQETKQIEGLAHEHSTGILYRGNGTYAQSRSEPTLFWGRRNAEKAIERTYAHSKGEPLSWLNDIEFEIERLREEKPVYV